MVEVILVVAVVVFKVVAEVVMLFEVVLKPSKVILFLSLDFFLILIN